MVRTTLTEFIKLTNELTDSIDITHCYLWNGILATAGPTIDISLWDIGTGKLMHVLKSAMLVSSFNCCIEWYLTFKAIMCLFWPKQISFLYNGLWNFIMGMGLLCWPHVCFILFFAICCTNFLTGIATQNTIYISLNMLVQFVIAIQLLLHLPLGRLLVGLSCSMWNLIFSLKNLWN